MEKKKDEIKIKISFIRHIKSRGKKETKGIVGGN